MKNTLRANLIFGAACLLVAGLVLSGCKGKREGAAQAEKVRVEVERIALGDVAEVLNLTGEIMPLATVCLTTKVTGRLERLAVAGKEGGYEAVAEGTRVTAGQQLGAIDHAVYAAYARQAEAAVAAAKAANEDAAREEKRVASLFEKGAATEQMRDKTITARAAGEAALKQAEAALDLARLNLDEAELKSPIDGVVVAKHIDEGNMVAAGMPVVTIQNMSKMKLLFSLPERYLLLVAAGKTRVSISSEALAGGPVEGTVSVVYPAIDRATRAVKAEVLFDNSDGRLRSGMFAKIAVEIERAVNVPVVPAAALLRQGNEVVAYVAEGPVARRRVVVTGLLENNKYAVSKGLKEGDTVVIRGQHMLKDGSEIVMGSAKSP